MTSKEALEMLYDDCEMDSGLMIKSGHSFEDLEKAFEALRSDIEKFSTIKQVITSCIALLTQSGSNTKELVMEKLRGLVE